MIQNFTQKSKDLGIFKRMNTLGEVGMSHIKSYKFMLNRTAKYWL